MKYFSTWYNCPTYVIRVTSYETHGKCIEKPISRKRHRRLLQTH